MNKKRLLILLLLCGNVSLQADESGWQSFWGAFFGSLIGSNNSYNTKSTMQISEITTVNGSNFRCACGEGVYAKLKRFGCCGALICESCLTSRRHTALINKTSPKCHACGRSFDYDMTDQRQKFDCQIIPVPSAPTTNQFNNNVALCASGCHCKLQVKFACGHGMCKSCLRSRVYKARKEARGCQLYVTCPACSDMLTNDIINQVN